MIVEGYTLDLYCDSDKCENLYASYNKPVTFAGSNRREAHSAAKKAGWLIKINETDADLCFCPKCVANGYHKTKKP